MKRPGLFCGVCVVLMVACLGGFYFMATTDIFDSKKNSESTGVSGTVATTLLSESTVMVDSEITTNDESLEQLEALGDIEAERSGENMTITFPATFIGDATQEKINSIVEEEEGLISGTLNSDGSVTYVMTPERYAAMLADMEKAIDQNLQGIIDDEQNQHIVSISHNDEYTEYTVEVNTKDLTLYESMTVMQLYMCSGMYYIFQPVTLDSVHVLFVDSETGELIQEADSKDMEEKLKLNSKLFLIGATGYSEP